MPELRRLLLGDDPRSWEAAGFTVDRRETTIGNIAIRFVDGPDKPKNSEDGGVLGWELTGIEDGSIDGISSTVYEEADPVPAQGPARRELADEGSARHRNRVSHLDHVVIMTPDIQRTISSLQAAGFSPRRTRDIPGSEPPRQQVFLWAGETILEVVGPVTASGSAPAAIWGLALTTDDMDAAVAELGASITAPKDAVQPGRRIATIKTKDLGVSIALALMTSHVSGEPSTEEPNMERQKKSDA